MKSMSIAALLFVIFLGALFVYVAEDIPAFGDANSAPNRYVWLFDMDAEGIEDDLNQGNISTILGDKLEGRGFPLPSGVAKLKEGEWDAVIIPEEKHYYPKEQKYYFIEKKGDKLDVFRYSLYMRFVEEGEDETLVPNMVTYILADYRGYDTLGETTVIFTAGVAVLLLLRRKEKRPE